MSHIRKLTALLLTLACLLPWGAVKAQAAGGTDPYIQRMIQYYEHYQQDAAEEIELLLACVREQDPQAAALWADILRNWDTMAREMPVPMDILPDGLPEDNSLCIVVLGYDLVDDGSMRPELLARLETTLRSAKKYPNAYIAVTGGPTARYARTSEAEEMARWLIASGISPDRVIVEKRAKNTTENATRTYRLLTEEYPSVKHLAVISSEYHVSTGCVLLQTVSSWEGAAGGPRLTVAGCAGATTGKSWNALYSQAVGICSITGIPYEKNRAPDL